MSKSSSPHPEWATKFRRPGTELRKINNRYYLYEYQTSYNPMTKKPQKKSGILLGSITEKDGFTESSKRVAQRKDALPQPLQPVLVREFGNCRLIFDRFDFTVEKLKEYFPSYWQQLLAIAYCRFVYHCPLKNIPYRLEASYMYQLLTGMDRFNDKSASAVLNSIGKLAEARGNYMRSFVGNDDYLLIDGTYINSSSRAMEMARKGYNSQHHYDGQLNLLYIYSATTRMPVFYRLLPGDIRDVKAFKNTLAMANIQSAIIIADKGFHSKANVAMLQEEGLDYIIPLKRDNLLVKYNSIEDNTYKRKATYFIYNKRIVWYLQQPQPDGIVHLFLDEELATKEEKDFLTRLKNNPDGTTMEKYYGKRNKFGTIAMLTPNKLDKSKDVYESYKTRMYIETMFDGMKNVLDADSTYMQNEDTLQGWMFINHICLQWHQSLYIELKEKELITKYSVMDYINMLTDLKKVNINGQWVDNECTNATTKLARKLTINI